MKLIHRAHAGYFSYKIDPHDHSAAEAGVLEVFEREMQVDGQAFFTNARHRGPGNDPPDCDAIALTGGLVGIEITEFIDPDSAAKAQAGKSYLCP